MRGRGKKLWGKRKITIRNTHIHTHTSTQNNLLYTIIQETRKSQGKYSSKRYKTQANPPTQLFRLNLQRNEKKNIEGIMI